MNEVVWTVNIMIGVGLLGVCIWIYSILITDDKESNSSDTDSH